jgi:hypothetical protein
MMWYCLVYFDSYLTTSAYKTAIAMKYILSFTEGIFPLFI